MYIGDIEIPIVSDIIDGTDAEVDEIKPLKEYGNDMDSVPVKHEQGVQTVTILGFLNQELHSEDLTLNEQKAEVRSLRDKTKLDNHIEYKEYKGHLLVENVNILDDGSSRIVDEVEIEARYFPWPKYYPVEGSLEFLDDVYGSEEYNVDNYGE